MAAASAAFSSMAVLDGQRAGDARTHERRPAIEDSPNDDSSAPLPEKKRRRRTHGAEEGKRYACDFAGCTKCPYPIDPTASLSSLPQMSQGQLTHSLPMTRSPRQRSVAPTTSIDTN